MSWLAIADTYSVTKAALWSVTIVQRLAVVDDGVQVLGLHRTLTDTPMTAGVDAPAKNDPADVVRVAYDGLEAAGKHEVLVDDASRQVKAGLAGPVTGSYPQLG